MDTRHQSINRSVKPPSRAERLEMELETIRTETPLMLAEYDQLTRMIASCNTLARPPAEFYDMVRALTNRFLLLGPLIIKHRDRINAARGGRACHLLGISAGSAEECIATACGILLREIAKFIPDEVHDSPAGPEPGVN